MRSTRRLLRMLSTRGPITLRMDALRLLEANPKVLRDGADAIARTLRGRTSGPLLSPVLIVEDDELVSAALAIHLAPLGRPIREVQTIAEAVEAMEGPLGAVILDLQLTDEEDGRDLLATHASDVPFLVLSSIADRVEVQQECRALGARAVLPKPVMPQSLLDTMRTVLGMPPQSPPADEHIVGLLRHRDHATEDDLKALISGISDLTWDTAVRTHLLACDQCRDAHRTLIHAAEG